MGQPRPRDYDYDKSVAEIREVIESYPGLYRTLQTYLRERVKEVLSGVERVDRRARLRPGRRRPDDEGGGDRGAGWRRSTASSIRTLSRSSRSRRLRSKSTSRRRSATGSRPGHVRRQSSALLASEEVADIFHDGKAYDVHVWSIPTARDSVSDVENLPIDTPDGGQVPLHAVADIAIRPVANTIKHERQTRRVDAAADLGGRDLASAVDELRGAGGNRVAARLPRRGARRGARAERGPGRPAALRALAAIVIFLLIQAGLNSVRLAVLVFLLLPMALAGAVLAAKLDTGILSLGSLVGFLTVLGIAGRNGILMVAHFQHLEREEGVPFGPDLVLQGAKDRLAPILMTASATGLALVPLVVAGPIPGNEIEHPLAVTILGGLVTATLLNLFVLPSLYLRFGKRT